jgi:hypothetical protein
MTRFIEDETVDVVIGALVGVIDVEGGPTSEQRAVLQALASGYWGRSDLDVGRMKPLSVDDTAAAVTDPRARRRLRELMVLLELCRHPLSEAQVARGPGVRGGPRGIGTGITDGARSRTRER